ncbi:hypothetical protein [Streptomyces sp. NPDC048442]|uniref:hypothetical protein n=1 Tax=Streptomyces sp. NPDC048442 TaxID=3154823 RepID=UPI00343A6621
MTIRGARALEEELLFLSKTERPRLRMAMEEAGEDEGDHDSAKEAECSAAEEELDFVEARIRDLKAKLTDSVVVDITAVTNAGKV